VNTTPAQLLSGTSARRTWVPIAAGGALACALAPVPWLLSIIPGSSAIANAPAVALVLAVAALIGARGQEARRQRLMAGIALGIVAVWALLFVAWGLALLYG
jgi:hypothetical protein